MAVAVFEFGGGSEAAFQFADPGGPGIEGFGGGGEGESSGGPSSAQL